MYISNIAHSKNVYINSNDYLLPPIAFSIPLADNIQTMQAYQTQNGLFHVALKATTERIRFYGISRSYVKSYLFKKELNNVLELFNNKFSNNGDTIIRAISPTGKYGFLKIHGRQKNKDKHLLWNMKEWRMEACLDDWLGRNIELIGGKVNFVMGHDNLLICDCWIINEKSRSTSNLMFDVYQKKPVFTGGFFSFNTNGNKLLLFQNKDSTWFYSPEKKRSTIVCAGEYGVTGGMDKSKLIPIYKHTSSGYLENLYLYDCDKYQLMIIPDSIRDKIKAVSKDGRYLLTYGKKYNDNLRILKADSYSFITEIPKSTWIKDNDYINFSPDSKRIIYTNSNAQNLHIFDIKKKKDIFTLNIHGEISRQTSWDRLPYKGIAFSDKLMALASYKLVLLNWHTGEIVKTFDLQLPKSPKMIFSPNGRYLLVENYLLDMDEMICLSNTMEPTPHHITDKEIIYNNAVYHFCTLKDLYEIVTQQ